MVRRTLKFAAALALLCASANADRVSAAELEDCDAMATIELSMIEPRIAACRESVVFVDAVADRVPASDTLCNATTTCGGLLPYLAYMQKYPCVQRAAFDEFSGVLLELCDAYPYRTINPKSVLVGKPPRSDL